MFSNHPNTQGVRFITLPLALPQCPQSSKMSEYIQHIAAPDNLTLYSVPSFHLEPLKLHDCCVRVNWVKRNQRKSLLRRIITYLHFQRKEVECYRNRSLQDMFILLASSKKQFFGKMEAVVIWEEILRLKYSITTTKKKNRNEDCL